MKSMQAMERATAAVRPDVRQRIAILSIVLACAASGPVPSSAMPWVYGVLAASTILGLVARSAIAVQGGVFSILYFALMHWLGKFWPLPLVAVLASFAAIVASSSWLRRGSTWFVRGKIDRTSWWMIAAFVFASATALIVWRYTTDADLSGFRAFVPKMPLWAIIAAIVPLAMLNAAFEETMWRGVLMAGLESIVGRGWLAVFLQGAGFGVWHYAGFPRGWIGVGLASIFAWMMGTLRMRSRGMLAPWIAHVFADVTIFVLIVVMVFARR